jgi:hypothetical protein
MRYALSGSLYEERASNFHPSLLAMLRVDFALS